MVVDLPAELEAPINFYLQKKNIEAKAPFILTTISLCLVRTHAVVRDDPSTRGGVEAGLEDGLLPELILCFFSYIQLLRTRTGMD